jgi:NADH dehydrogenase
VRASPAAEWLNAPADRAGRVQVEPDLTIAGHPEIFAIGDTVTIDAWEGRPVPWIAPAAKQQGRHVAETIKARLRGETRGPFRYRHAGSLAQIGKRLAVIDFGRIKLRGAIAWWIWGIAHIYFLIGLRHRMAVALSWLWIYARDQRAARLITQGSSKVVDESSHSPCKRGEDRRCPNTAQNLSKCPPASASRRRSKSPSFRLSR